MEKVPEPFEILIAMFQVQNLLERKGEAFFQSFGLTAAKFNILNLLSTNGGRMDQSDLVNQLLVGKSSISIVLTRMVREHLIKRKPHPVDRRQAILVITDIGTELWAKTSPTYEDTIRKIFEQLPVSHRSQFLKDLNKLKDAI
jgi:DNA-binding MarR family transcriptional regulator